MADRCFLREKRWFLSIYDPNTLVLGDVGPISKVESAAELRPIPGLSEDITGIFLPISHTHLVMGTRDKGVPNVGAEEINRGMAACSSLFFVASNNSDREKNYAVELGIRANLIPQKTLETIASDLIQELLE